MKAIFDNVSLQCTKLTTRAYSTSFSLGIYFLNSKLRNPIYSIYGFVRFADEIVDSFEGYKKKQLLEKFFQHIKQHGGALEVESYTTAGMAHVQHVIERLAKQYNVRMV